MRGLCLHLRLFIPLNTKLTWSLRVASYTFKNISYQSRGQRKGRRNFEPFDKAKKASRKFVRHIRLWKKSQPVSQLWGEIVKGRCYEMAGSCQCCQAWNEHQHGDTRMLDLSVHVCPLTSQGNHPPASTWAAAWSSQHDQQQLGGCPAPAAISKHRAAQHIPQTAPIMGFPRFVISFIEP